MGFLSNLFGGNKPKETCPICGQPMGFFSKTGLSDGAICDKCCERVKTLIGDRLFSEITLGEVKAAIAAEEASNAKLTAAFGNAFPNLFKVEFSHPISMKATDVGIARAKFMKNATAVKGKIVSGSFDKGAVTVIRGSAASEASLVETAPFTDGQSVDSTLSAHLYKGAIGEGKTAWLILAGDVSVTSGDLVGGA